MPQPLRFGLWMTLSCACFAALVSLVRYLDESHGMHVFVVSFWRNVFAIVVFLPWFIRAGRSAWQSPRHDLLFLRGLLMVMSSTAMFFAVTLMPLAEATAISFTTPLFSVILAVLILGERIGIHRSAALVVGMIGMLIILRPGVAVFEWAGLIPIFSALTFGGVIVAGRILAPVESPQKIAAYIGLWSLPLSLVPAIFYWQWPDLEELGWLLATGAAAALNMYAISGALRIGEASQTAPWDFLRLPFVALIAWFWFGQSTGLWTWAGAAVILASVMYVTWRESIEARTNPAGAAKA